MTELDKDGEDSANSRPFIPKEVYPRRSIQVAGGSWAGHGDFLLYFVSRHSRPCSRETRAGSSFLKNP